MSGVHIDIHMKTIRFKTYAKSAHWNQCAILKLSCALFTSVGCTTFGSQIQTTESGMNYNHHIKNDIILIISIILNYNGSQGVPTW